LRNEFDAPPPPPYNETSTVISMLAVDVELYSHNTITLDPLFGRNLIDRALEYLGRPYSCTMLPHNIHTTRCGPTFNRGNIAA
jgi:hypothetical protein